ncbi:MAG: 3-phosphoshikimate 1-carboxyvinyltransferase [Propionibacterium sp.]|nr:3-phosphoshikimate 1-carboxyvinyltransferase [Propionibacterium sp.]
MITALPHATGAVHGSVVVPGSKSETNRALVLAALGDGPSTVTGALKSRDSDLMLEALASLGVGIEDQGRGTIVVTPGPIRGGGTIDCGLAGTVMRFIPPLVLLADAPVTFVGDPHASERPMAGLLDALRQLGATVDSDRLPFTVTPAEPRGGTVSIDASPSSQFVSGPLLVGALLPGGLTVRHVGDTLPSRPHIAMTTAMLADRGGDARETDERTWRVDEGVIGALDSRVEPDLTNASVFLSAAAVRGGEVRVPGWSADSAQPGVLFLDVARRMGCETELAEGAAVLRRTGPLRGIDVDLAEASELTCVVAALAAVADGVSTIRGVGHIRGHETDRIAALLTELRRAGIEAEELPDGLRITGGTPRAAVFETYADHRMVHFAALLGLVAEGSSVTDMECVSKTMPHFPTDWAELV